MDKTLALSAFIIITMAAAAAPTHVAFMASFAFLEEERYI